ncbi:hypothetical protein LINPERPRIM_LOCUS941 [Linum perenne]
MHQQQGSQKQTLSSVDSEDSLQFRTRKAAMAYYDAYAHETGFGVRINYQQKKNTRNVAHALVEDDGSTRQFYMSYYDIMCQTAGGAQHMGFTVKDLYNHLGSESAKLKKADG